MTALFPSYETAQVFVPTPVRLSTTGAAAPITPDFAPVGTPADLYLQIVDSAGGSVCAAALNALPAGITINLGPAGSLVSITAVNYNVPGLYFVGLGYTPDADYQTVTTSFQWGGWVDMIADIATWTEQTRKTVMNRVEVDDPAAPTELVIYDDDGTTPLATRTIANADGSAVNPAQILRLGAVT
jgi:hypothetical protein